MWIACGAIVGTAQWLALRECLHVAPAWIAGACGAWVVGIWAGYVHRLLPSPGFFGGKFHAPRFVPSSIVSSTLGWLAGTYAGLWVFNSHWDVVAYLAASAAGGAVIGAASAPPVVGDDPAVEATGSI